ncbi:EpsG family protein [Clostridium tyrobutyricum]|uniref:EpsG family protein n=1 Tax=Clostridium tyrobutyricum TaxID=1519 RepID=UPI00073D4A6C|nr:EpsG family protein [Clostridium tyrobutyricum]
MIFYLVNILIFLCYSSFLYLIDKKKKIDKIITILFCIHFGGIMMIRSSNVGTDVKMYTGLFRVISYSSVKDAFKLIQSAPLYVLYNKAVALISTNPQTIIIFNSFIIIILAGIFIYRNTSNVLASIYCYIFLYFYFTSFNIARQFIAIVLVINSFYYLKNNKIIKFLILIAIATLVHNTAIVGLILLPLSRIKWNNIKIGILAIITAIIMGLYNKILSLFLIVFPRYNMYINGNSQFSLADTGHGKNIIVSFFYLAIVILCMYYLRKTKQKTEMFNVRKELYFLTSILTIAVVGGIIFYNNLLISRIILYFSIFVVIYIPRIIDNISRTKFTRFILYYTLMILVAVPGLVELYNNISGVIPYGAFWY